MIHFLKGIVAEVGEDFLCIETQGVGYKVHTPNSVLARVTEGEAFKVHIFTYVREDIFALYGFAEASDRTLFEKLMSVSGVGAKMALGLLSALNAQEIITAVRMGDIATLTRANGVGKKLAERMILELKNKLGNVSVTAAAQAVPQAPKGGVQMDVLSALTNMGFKYALAQQALANATQTQGENADFGLLLKDALKILRSA